MFEFGWKDFLVGGGVWNVEGVKNVDISLNIGYVRCRLFFDVFIDILGEKWCFFI